MPSTRSDDAAAANLAMARGDLAAARAAGDHARAELLDALVGSGGALLIYRPDRDHYGVLLGSVDDDDHVAVMVPGVGTDRNLHEQWLPSARNLFEAAESTSVILWKAYDEPPDLVVAVLETIECDESLRDAARDLTAFVDSLGLRPDQSLTVVAHSFGSVVTGTALADFGLRCTDVVVAGSPGMAVDDLRQLHLDRAHFFSEEAPGDPIAELGVFGAEPTAPTFGGTRMRTNAPGRVAVSAHSEYFVPGSESLANIVHVVTGRYRAVAAERPSFADDVGGLVAWAVRMPMLPVDVVARRYHGPGHRVLTDACHLVDLGATQSGNAIREGLDAGGRALGRVGRRIADRVRFSGVPAGTPADVL
jgi:pimeloyl-ACP methyl ester carboxylesterase